MNKFLLDIYIIWRISWSEIVVKYRKSFFGPIWITLNMLITIVALSIVFSSLFGMNVKTYMPYVYCGLLSWNFIAMVVGDSVTAYINGAIKNYNFHLFFFPLKVTIKNFVIFSHNLLIYFVLIVFINNEIFNFNFLYFFISIPFYFINACSLAMIIGIISLKYRDIGQIILNSIYLLFLLTPVFWDPKILSNKKIIIVDLNPVYHIIEIMRQPMLGNVPEVKNYLVCIGITLLNLFLAYLVIKYNEANKALWI